MKEKIAKLIDLKSIVTLIVCVFLCIFTWKGIINSEVFAGISSSIFTYFFTKKSSSEK